MRAKLDGLYHVKKALKENLFFAQGKKEKKEITEQIKKLEAQIKEGRKILYSIGRRKKKLKELKDLRGYFGRRIKKLKSDEADAKAKAQMELDVIKIKLEYYTNSIIMLGGAIE